MELAQGLLPLASALILQARNSAAASEKQNAAAALRLAYPHLVSPENTKGGSLIAAAANLRAELRRAFPGHKFRVTTERFAGGDSLHVGWTDGPASSRVEAIADKYQPGYFDGMTDSYNYDQSAWNICFGQAKFVQVRRNYSPALTAWAREPGNWEEERPRWAELQNLNIKAVKKPDAAQ